MARWSRGWQAGQVVGGTCWNMAAQSSRRFGVGNPGVLGCGFMTVAEVGRGVG